MILRVLFMYLLNVNVVFSDESQCIINGKKALHIVDPNFLGISIDPTILFSGIKLSETTIKLVKHLSPAYLRIAGPSTSFLKFVEDESKAISILTEESEAITFSPSMWWTLNEWIRTSNFTPVFALNDQDRVNDDWDPKGVLSLLEITSKININCYWQLGFDCSQKTEHIYKEDLTTLKHILDAFPEKKGIWKTVGSDISRCLPSDHTDVLRRQIEQLDVDAVLWEPETRAFNDGMHRLLSSYHPKISVWITAPKSPHLVSFSTALNWGVEIGEAAKNGFSVIFRQPRLQELFSDTPAYWVSILHKHLMGQNILDVKITSLRPTHAYVYAHCSKNQNSYSVRGAMTVMIINNGTEEHKTSLLVAGSQLKNIEVRSYILTSPSEDSLETYLNEGKLTLDNITDSEYDFKPKLRRAKVTTHLTVTTPAKSIGFYVLPGARIPVCIHEEDETNLILEEIHSAQSIDFPEHKSVEIFSRLNNGRSIGKLSDLYRKIEEELEDDEKFYKRKKLIPLIRTEDWKKSLLDKVMESKSKKIDDKLEERKSFLDETKFDVKKLFDKAMDIKFDIKKVDLKNLLMKDDEKKDKPKLDLDLSSAEILKILTDRAKAKVEKRVGLANTDLDNILEKAFKSKIRVKRRGGHAGRGRGSRKRILIKQRPKRDINMALLKLQTSGQDKKQDKKQTPKEKSKFNFDKKEATIRRPDQTSDEFLQEEFTPHEEKPSKIFAGFASPEDTIPDMAKVLPGLPIKSTKENLFASGFPNSFSSGLSSVLPKTDMFSLDQTFAKLALPSIHTLPLFQSKSVATTSSPTKAKTFVDYVKEDENEKVEASFDELEDDLNGYHGFHEEFGDDITVVKPKHKKKNPRIREMWEFDDLDKSELLESEFIINNNENKGEIEKTIKRLESFFNDPRSKYDTESKSDTEPYEAFGRFKREVSSYTEKDIEFYKKLMQDNIQHMRNSLMESKLRNEKGKLFDTNERKNIFKDKGFLKSLFPQSILLRTKKIEGRNNIPKDFKPSESMLYEHQIKFLKGRLAHRKKLEEFQHSHAQLSKKLNVDDLQKKLKEHFDLSNRFRKTRSAKNTFDIRYDEIYIPKVNISNKLLKSYQSKLENIKEWQPEDILKLPKIDYNVKYIDEKTENEKDIPIVRNRLQIDKRLPRDIKGEIDSVENTIDGIINSIKKDNKFTKPKLDQDSGEYSIILPTKDAISLSTKNGNTDIKIHMENEIHRDVDSYTCPYTDFTTETATNTAITLNDDVETTLINDQDEVNIVEITAMGESNLTAEQLNKMETRSGYEQDKPQVSISNVEFKIFDKIFDTVNSFIDKVHTTFNRIFE